MDATVHGERRLTELDFTRLRRLPGDLMPAVLADLLDEAEVVGSRDIPADVVTMYARAEVQDLETGQRQVLCVCYPADAQPGAGLVSVLSPVGSALLGLKAGSLATWRTPGGEEKAAEVMTILFQPEASGDFLT